MFFTPNRYYQGNASTGFANTHFDPVAAADSRFSLTGHSFGTWLINNNISPNQDANFGPFEIGNSNNYLGTSIGGNPSRYEFRAANSSNQRFNIGQPGNQSVPINAFVDGLHGVSRLDAANVNLLLNSVASTYSIPSQALSGNEMYISAYNKAGTAASFTGRKLAMAWIGSGDLGSGTNYTNFYNALNTFISARQSI
jgi:hypothetical protein